MRSRRSDASSCVCTCSRERPEPPSGMRPNSFVARMYESRGRVGQNVAEELLRLAGGVDVRSVDEIDPELERLRDARFGPVVGDAAAVGEPGAEADLGDLEIAGAELSEAHVSHAIRVQVEETFELAGRTLTLLRPPSADELIDEAAFAVEEFLPYWAELWPSGVALAEHVGERDLAGRRVLELGAGLGLPSLAAALRGADVLATDWADDAVALLARERRAERGRARAPRSRAGTSPSGSGPAGISCSPPTSCTSSATPISCSSCCRGSKRGDRARRARPAVCEGVPARSGESSEIGERLYRLRYDAARAPPSRRPLTPPHIVWKPIPFGARRKAETAQYAQRHYGITVVVLHPKVIVEHYTATSRSAPRGTPSRPTRPTRSSASCRARARISSSIATGRSTSSFRSTSSAGTRSASTTPRSASSTSALRTPSPPRPGAARSLARADPLADGAVPHLARERDRPQREPVEPVPQGAVRAVAPPDARRLDARRHERLPSAARGNSLMCEACCSPARGARPLRLR